MNEPIRKVVHPMCRKCGWAMGGIDSWNGRACKCGHSEPAIQCVVQEDFLAQEISNQRGSR